MIQFRSIFFGINPQIISLVALSLLAHVTLSGGKVASSLFVLQEGHSELIAGLAYGLYGLMPALLLLHVGRWVDRVGPKLIMRLSLLLIVTGLVLPAIHLSVASVLFCAALSGLGFGAYILSAQVSVSLMKVKQESDRTGMFAWLQIGTSISSVAGPTLIGLVIDNKGFSVAYAWLTGIVCIGLIWSFFASVPEGVPQNKEAKRSGIVQDVLKDRSLLKIYLLSMAVYLAWDCFAFMIPVLGSERGYSAASIGMVLSFFAAGTLIVRAMTPWLSRKSNEWRTLCISFAFAAVVFFMLPLADSIAFLCVLSLVFGLSAGVGHPNIQSLILHKVGAAKSGEASGLRLMTGNFSAMLSTTACGAVTALAGMLPVFMGIAAIMSVSSWHANRGQKALAIPESAEGIKQSKA